MRIQQAIFTSSDQHPIKGYQLVAKSSGIDRNLAKELHRWSPSNVGSGDPEQWTINYFPVNQDFVAVTRTVLGGPEYSNRGGAQVVTLIAVLHNSQFRKYHNNAALVCKTAIAFGCLRFPIQMPNGSVEPFALPDEPIVEHAEGPVELKHSFAEQVPPRRSSENVFLNCDPDSRLLTEMARLIDQKRRFAIIGASRPKEIVAKLIRKLPVQHRREFSFTTGLPPARHRPFQAHFLLESNPILHQILKAEGITSIHLPLAN